VLYYNSRKLTHESRKLLVEMKPCVMLVSANGLNCRERDLMALKLMEVVGGCLESGGLIFLRS
jgi:hypothetical protein